MGAKPSESVDGRDQPDEAVASLRPICAKCGATLAAPSGAGRPARYCGDLCKRLVEHEVRRVDRRLDRYAIEQREQKARGVQDDDLDEHERQRRLRALRAWIRTDEARLRELLSADRGNQKEST